MEAQQIKERIKISIGRISEALEDSAEGIRGSANDLTVPDDKLRTRLMKLVDEMDEVRAELNTTLDATLSRITAERSADA